MRAIIFYFVLFFMASCSAVVTERPTANPELAVVSVPPGAGFVWVNESWRYNYKTHSYRQAPGHWVKPRRSHAVWVDGYWVQSRRGWRYVDGHWRH